MARLGLVGGDDGDRLLEVEQAAGPRLELTGHADVDAAGAVPGAILGGVASVDDLRIARVLEPNQLG